MKKIMDGLTKAQRYVAKNREKVRAKKREWVSKNRDRIRAYVKANKDIYYAASMRWKNENKKRTNEYARNYANRRYATEPDYRLLKLLRRHSSRLGLKKRRDQTSIEYLGCTIPEAKKHIESLWLTGMSWENHSVHGWHIDHIRPLASFDFADPHQVKCALHYTNLQPLWAKENLSKGRKIQ